MEHAFLKKNLLVLVLLPILSFSQGAEELFCKIMEANTNFPVPYATIQIKE